MQGGARLGENIPQTMTLAQSAERGKAGRKHSSNYDTGSECREGQGYIGENIPQTMTLAQSAGRGKARRNNSSNYDTRLG